LPDPGGTDIKVLVPAEIVLLRAGRIDPAELRRLVDLFFEDMVKYVVRRTSGERTTTRGEAPRGASSTRP
jgi:hypothetical protein